METQTVIYYEGPINLPNDRIRTLSLGATTHDVSTSRWGLYEERRSIFDREWRIISSSSSVEIWGSKTSSSTFIGVASGPFSDIICRIFTTVDDDKCLPKAAEVNEVVYEFSLDNEPHREFYSRDCSGMSLDIVYQDDEAILRVGFETKADLMEWKLSQ